MERNLKILFLAIVGLAIICIAAIAFVYYWNISAGISGGGNGDSLFFSYSSVDGMPLNLTQNAQNGSFTGLMYVEGTSDTMLIALQDYNVTPFYFNGSVNKTHLIAQNAYINQTGMVIPYDAKNPKATFNVTGIPDGFHDVEFIGFVDPFNYTGAGWQSGGPFTSGGVRFNVIMNNSAKTMPAYTDGPSSNGTLYSKNYTFAGPNLVKEPFSNKLWQRENVKGDSVIDYYVSLGHPMINGNVTNYSFAIIQLLDYHQIPIRVGSTDTAYYGYIDKNTSAAIHLSLQAPKTSGPHKLVVIVVADPYENLEVAPYVENNQTWTTNKNMSSSTSIEHQDIIVA